MSVNTRVTITLSAETAEDLRIVSATLGITRSALIAELLAMSSAELRIASLKTAYRPASPHEPSLRLRGDSTEVIQERIQTLWRALNED